MAALSEHSDEFRLIAAALAGCDKIGDDAAVLDDGLLLATDTVLEDRHFTAETDPRLIGRKAIAVNLSDIAAMGGRPTAITIALTIGAGWTRDQAAAILHGCRATADEYGTVIVGGDTTSWDGPLAISVSILGQADRPVLRSTARPGDHLFVSGPLGQSLPTGHHLNFEPRLSLGQQIACDGKLGVSAMMDISDGLSSDLRHLATASGCGAEIEAERIPRRRNATLEQALGDGEDFELLVAANGPTHEGLIHIGRLTDRAGCLELVHGRDREELRPSGWSHGIESD